MKKTITTEEFFYDNCDILTKKITTVEEYEEHEEHEEQIFSNSISTPIAPYHFSTYPTSIGDPISRTYTTSKSSSEQMADGIFIT